MTVVLRSEQIPTDGHQRSDHGARRVAAPSSSGALARLLDQRLQLIVFRRARWCLDAHDSKPWGVVAFSRP
jgi:hypothetical protein